MGCANNIPTRYFPFNIFTFDEVNYQLNSSMLPLEAITMPHLLKLIAFDRLVYREIQLIAVTLMTYSRARASELRMITKDSY